MTTDRRSFLQTSLTGLAALASVPVLGGLAGCQQTSLPADDRARKTALPTEKLAERVTLITGAPGNVVALSSSDGVLLVDSGSSAFAQCRASKPRRRTGAHAVQHALPRRPDRRK